MWIDRAWDGEHAGVVPDWFYRTIAQRCLNSLPDRLARALALGTIGTLGRSSPGRAAIDFLGHMRPPDTLGGVRAGLRFNSRIGLGPWIDPEGRATRALARFGTGFIEVGPVSISQRRGRPPARGPQTLIVPGPEEREAASLETWRQRLARQGRLEIPLWVRVAPAPGIRADEARQQIEQVAAALADVASAYVVEGAPEGIALTLPHPWLRAGMPTKSGQDGSIGVVVDPRQDAPGTDRVTAVRALREQLGQEAVLVVAAGGDPADLHELLEAGADLIEADAALLFTGPGVIKRTNELIGSSLDTRTHAPLDTPAPRHSWFWGVVLGLALAGGGVLTLGLALGRVLLPYDEAHLGMSAEVLRRMLPRVHDFMAHDRATLAGTMLGLGAFYAMLAWNGVRRGEHWAQVAVVASALLGFVSFFSFLGFGYFDPLHAFVSAVLLQFTLLMLVTRLRGADVSVDVVADGRSDRTWQRSQWGQLFFVVHAAGLLIAGAVISIIGMTEVFVGTDLDFLCTSAAELSSINDRLIGVIAHDRASLGGMLLACGLSQLLATLWGFRRGRRWLWSALFLLGLPAYAAALGIHLKVGYTSAWHLAPAFVGLALWAGGLVLSAGWLRRGAAAPSIQHQHPTSNAQ